jgi:hypothetical protein
MSFLIACFSAQQLERSFSDRRTRNDATGRLPHRSSGVQEHPNGLTRVKILEATGEGADLAVAEKHPTGGRA